jgi:lipopolysaccharide export system protein LptC
MMAAGMDNRPTEGRAHRAAEFAPRNSGDVLTTLSRRRRYVQFMKFVLPMLAVAIVAAVLVWPQLGKRVNFLPLNFTDVDSSNAALVMKNPRYRGVDASNQPYIVTADRAIQDPQDDKLVTMDNVKADLTMNDGGWWSLNADTGYYDGKQQLLNLYGNVAVFGDKGYEMHGLSAEINLDTKVLSSDDKVWGQSGLGTIKANGLRVYDKGRVIHFINGVNTTIFPRQQRS